MRVRFIDTTFRDGAQSLWALGLRTGMIDAVAEQIDRAGFDAVEVPVNAIYMKKCVRDLKEDPWEVARLVARKLPNTVKGCMAGGHLLSFEPPPPRALIELYYTRLVEIGALNRAQITSNTFDQIKRSFSWIVPLFKKLGLQIAVALSYTISPHHTDEYYAQKIRDILPFKPDRIYLKDQGGLLTVDRARTLLPAMIRSANGVEVELHSHCTTGLAELVYLEALAAGIRTVHTAIPPLAEGSSQPSVLSVARNARLQGHSTDVDERLIRSAAERLTGIAKQDNLPIGAPLQYDYAQYVHQVPGGVISNLKYQLTEMRLADRLDEVLAESVQVRKDMGYPIMITPHSQFVVTQAAINVVSGERYKLVTDELIRFAQGTYGEDSCYAFMDRNLKDKLLSLPRAKELTAPKPRDVPLSALRAQFGGAGVSDEEFLLRYIMKGDKEVAAMRAAGPPKQYFDSRMPLLTLIQELGKQKKVRYVQVQRGSDSLLMQHGC